MAQPPPRKGAFTKTCQNVNKEQHSKLSLKNHHENDLLEDIRSFVKQKASIEKHYADGMLKLSTGFLNKRITNLPEVNDDPDKPLEKNVYTIWRHVLSENEKIARARLAAVQVLQEEVEKDAKVLRSLKQTKSKKSLERLLAIQKELQATITEVDRTKRAYFDDESSAHDVRDKAKDAEDRSRGRKKDMMSLFQSKSTLRKHAGKLSAKQEEFDIRSTGARNDYILSLASANAHQDFYFKHDLQESMRNSELNFYEKISSYINTVARAEVLTTTAVLSSFTNIRDQAERITRDYNYECYLKAYPCLREHINYEYEHCEGDTVFIITPSEHDGGYSLNYEARQNASKLNQAVKTIKAYNKRIKACHYHKSKGLKQEPNDTGGPDLDTKIIELQVAIRNAEMEKAKAEARLAKLREGGISVDEYIDAFVYSNAGGEEEKPQPSTTEEEEKSQVKEEEWPTVEPNSVPENDERTDAKKEEAVSVVENGNLENPTKSESDNDWATWEEGSAPNQEKEEGEEEKQKLYDFNQGWADFDKQEEIKEEKEDPSEVVPEKETNLKNDNVGQAIVLYNFEAQSNDELSVNEQDVITILFNECDEEGWVMAVNFKGEKGYVPQNYLEIEGEAGVEITESTTEQAVQDPSSCTEPSWTEVIQKEPETPETIKAPLPVVEEVILTRQESFIDEVEDENEDSSSSVSSSEGPPSDLPPPPPLPQESPTKKPSRPTSMALGRSQSTTSGDFEYCKALYDYEATGSDEISFLEGQIIRIHKRDPNGIDDGWWLGELYEGGDKTGLFPSIVVEECLENGDSPGEESTSDYSGASPGSSEAPPCFTPPDINSGEEKMEKPIQINVPMSDKKDEPSQQEQIHTTTMPLMPPIMVTNPTPIAPSTNMSLVESPSEDTDSKEKETPVLSFSVNKPEFSIEISEEKHEIYQSKAESIVPKIEVQEPLVAPPVAPPMPTYSLNPMEIVVTAPTPRVQSPVQNTVEEKKKNIIEELRQHPVFRERKIVSEKPTDNIVSEQQKIDIIQRKIEPAVKKIEQEAVTAAKSQVLQNKIKRVDTESSSSEDEEHDKKLDFAQEAKSSSSSESEAGPDVLSSDEEEKEEPINPMPPKELEVRQLKKLDKLKESTA